MQSKDWQTISSYLKNTFWWMDILKLISIIDLSFQFFTLVLWPNKLVFSMNVAQELFMMINIHILRNFESKVSFVSIQHNNIHNLIIKMNKAANGMSPEIMNDISKLRENTYFHLRHLSKIFVDAFQSVFNDRESASYLGSKTWEQKFLHLPKFKISTLLMVLKNWRSFHIQSRIRLAPSLIFIYFILIHFIYI